MLDLDAMNSKLGNRISKSRSLCAVAATRFAADAISFTMLNSLRE